MAMIKIKNDVFNITKRLKKIYKGFYISFDKHSNCYYIMDKYLSNKIICKLKYLQLDYRLLDFIYKNSAKNKEQIFSQMDNDNKKLEDYRELSLKTFTTDRLKEIYNYSLNHTSDFNCNKSYKNIWG